MKKKYLSPNSVVLVKFCSRTEAKKFAMLMKRAVKSKELPIAILKLLEKDLFEVEEW